MLSSSLRLRNKLCDIAINLYNIDGTEFRFKTSLAKSFQ